MKTQVPIKLVYSYLTNNYILHLVLLVGNDTVVIDTVLKNNEGLIMGKCERCGGPILYNQFVVKNSKVYHPSCWDDVKKQKAAERLRKRQAKKAAEEAEQKNINDASEKDVAYESGDDE